jgi:hypothetical protein
MNEINDSSIPGLVPAGDFSRDGDDPDRHTRRIGGSDWQWCADAVQDVKALREMSESDVRHYAGTPRGKPLNDNRKR